MFIVYGITISEIFVANKSSNVACKEKVTLFLTQNDLVLLQKHEKYWISLGLNLEFFGNGIHVTQVPSCLYFKIEKVSVFFNWTY